MIKSPIKYTGGKSRLLPSILPLIQSGVDVKGSFVDLFCGSLTVSMNVNAESYVCNDTNEHLMNFYNVDKLALLNFASTLFKESNNDKERYLKIRKSFNEPIECGVYTDNINKAMKAAQFYYLNKHCFNGLYRVNSKGEFNVPFGSYKSININKTGLDELFKFLNRPNVDMIKKDFRQVEVRDSVVYCDPPYVPLTTDFKYSKNGFNLDDQQDLVDYAIKASQNGCTVFISNHDTDITRELYSGASDLTEINVTRTVSGDNNGRGKVKELLVRYG